MSAALERRYGRLLRLYPAGYRQAHGAEVLDTLLAAAEDGRMRPAWRETGALVLGALRAHAGHDRRSVQDSWLTAIRIAALMLLVHGLAGVAMTIGLDVTHGLHWGVPDPAPLVLGVLALVLALRGRYLAAAAGTVAAFALSMDASHPAFLARNLWFFPLAAVLLLALVRRRPQPAAGLLRWAPLLPAVLVAADQVFGQAFPSVSGILQRGLLAVACVGGLLWLVVDERVAMALGLVFLNTPLVAAFFIVGQDAGGPAAYAALAVTTTGPVILLLASGAVARRQAEI